MKVIVIGGAGYIGSHVVLDLIKSGHQVIVFDNLSSGDKKNLPENIDFILGDILNKKDLESAFLKNNIDFVMHFAAFKAAGESMLNPNKYAQNNITGSMNILNVMDMYGVKNIIFSSSAAVYGYPQYLPIDERHPTCPINFYGYTKLVVENLLNWYSELKGMNYASLRYFNAAGYSKNKNSIIEKNPANLLPIIMEVAINKRDSMNVFGNDYDTKDGSCIRDYIHVNDLSNAHIKSIDYIVNNKNNLILNLATGFGNSIFEVIELSEKITNKKINYKVVERRDGDPAELYAKSVKAFDLLNWRPEYSSLEFILESMWKQYK